MTETTLPPERDRIEPVDIQQEMQNSYIDYAMSVIVGRALPDVRDGLKPVHIRVLYSMFDSGFRPDRGYNKCARVVGDVMGNYHPHGDSAIYDALVRLAQPWSLRYPLIDGQGNFGSPGNDPAAAMRYCIVPAKPAFGLLTARRRGSATSCRTRSRTATTRVDLKVLDRNGDPVRADMLFHSGEHPTLKLDNAQRLRADRHAQPPGALPGHRGSACRPCCGSSSKRSSPGDRVVAAAHPARRSGTLPLVKDYATAVFAGAFVADGLAGSEPPGRLRQHRPATTSTTWSLPSTGVSAGRDNVHTESTRVRQAFCTSCDVPDCAAPRQSVLAELGGSPQRGASGCLSSSGRRGRTSSGRSSARCSPATDPCSALPRGTVQISYSTRSDSARP